MHIRPNITRREWNMLKEFKAKEHLINYLQIKGQRLLLNMNIHMCGKNKIKSMIWT